MTQVRCVHTMGSTKWAPPRHRPLREVKGEGVLVLGGGGGTGRGRVKGRDVINGLCAPYHNDIILQIPMENDFSLGK